ncbi:MAG: hypothetical protein KGM96_10430 [Acidobacteriota bacterium]|nr:hypothetical protein [Acidobacteriota bacterium]
MSKMRGIVLIVLGVLALYHGWTMHPSHPALLAYALGAVAIAIGIWRVTQKPPPRRQP